MASLSCDARTRLSLASDTGGDLIDFGAHIVCNWLIEGIKTLLPVRASEKAKLLIFCLVLRHALTKSRVGLLGQQSSSRLLHS